MDKRKPPIPPDEHDLPPASGRISAVVATRPMTRFGRAILATALILIGVNDMSNHATSFEGTKTGVAPEGWTATLTGSGDPKWTVEDEATAPSKSKVLKQSGRATYPLLLKNDSSIKDGFVEVKFKAIAGSQDRAAGIVWRAKDANNYYVTRANALEDNVVLYKTVNGVRSPLDIVGRKGGYGTEVKVPANVWHTLRVDFKGARFSVSFNGQQLFEVEDSTFADAGKVGLWTKADSVTLFDDVSYGETK
jgi:hypothetical protein